MLKEFIDFVDSVLPSVDPEAKDKAKAAIEQFEKDGNGFEYLLPTTLTTLSQGDIVSDIPFSYFKEDGKQYIFKAKGMVISTSCHIDQKDVINIVPVLPLDFFAGDDNGKRELKANRIFNYMYLPENVMNNYFIDFSRINTYNKNITAYNKYLDDEGNTTSLKLETYQTKKTYIDYNNDGKYSGKEESDKNE